MQRLQLASPLSASALVENIGQRGPQHQRHGVEAGSEQQQERMGIVSEPPESKTLAGGNLAMTCDSFEGAHGLTKTVEKYMELGDTDHFGRGMKSVGRDSSAMNSSPGRRQRSSGSSRQTGTLGELEEDENAGHSSPRKNSEAWSR